MREPLPLTREELHELVWSEPVARIAERYGLSGAGLRKLCLRQGVPVPPRGHWAKAAAGKKALRPPLPPKTQPRYLPAAGSPALERRTPLPSPARPQAPEVSERVAYEADPRHKIRVTRRRASSSTWAPALLATAQRAFRDQRGLLRIKLPQHGISATIDQKSVTRLAHILAAFEHACETRGFLHVGRKSTQPAQAVVKGITLSLHFGERTTRHEVPCEARSSRSSSWLDERRVNRYEPTGSLTLAVMSRGEDSWSYLPGSQLVRETPGRPLEERLNDAMVVMQWYAAEVHKRELEHQKREELRRAAKEAARAVDLARQRRQLEIQTLDNLVDRWAHAERIRAFVNAVVAEGSVPSASGTTSNLADWRAWALAIADEIDPLTEPGVDHPAL